MRLLGFAALAALVLVGAAPAARGQEGRSAAAAPTLVSVSASGKSEARPDMATVTLGVSTTGRTAEAALAENNQRMRALTQALRGAGIAERDIQTAWVSVYPQWDRRSSSEQSTIVGYQASNTVRVDVRDIERVSRVIDASVAAGGNTLSGIRFAHQDEEAQQDAARRDAMAQARRRAELYASALGLRVHRVVSVTEAGAAQPEAIVVTGTRLQRQGFESGGPLVSPGEIETRANVSVSFELR